MNRKTQLASLSMMFLLMGCASSPVQQPVRIAELLISPVDMPQGWGLLEISDSYLGDQGQIEGAYAIFFYFQPGYLLRAEEAKMLSVTNQK